MIAVRWTLSLLLAVLWSVIAITNVSIVWRRSARKDEQAPSLVPVAGGLIALLAVVVCPSESPLKWLALLPALVLDVGSVPYLVLLLLASLPGVPHVLLRKYLESSGVIKLGVALLGWFALVILLGGAQTTFGLDAAFVEIGFWPLTVIYCVLCAILHLRLKRYRPAERDQ